MERWIPIPIGSKCYRPRSGTQSIERLINLYADASQPTGKTGVTVIGTPGLKAWSDVGDGPVRGLHRAFGYVWVVSGTDLYAVNESTKVATLVGDVDGTGPVRMIHNDTHVAIVTTNFAYAANTTSIVVLPETGLSGAAFQDGYGIYPQRNTQNFWLSGLDDLTDIDPLDFETADSQPDKCVSCLSVDRQVWIGKEETIEIYDNVGDPDFPFARALVISRGVLSPGSFAKASQSVIWLGDDKRVYRSQGFTPVPVSTEDIDRLIGDTTSPETSEAFVYTQAGHEFYCLNFSDLSLCYDVSTGQWHERQTYGLDRWRVQGYCRLGDRHLVGDYETGEIYELDLSTFDEDGAILPRTMVFPPLSNDPQPIIVHELFVDFETGVGLTSGQGSDPKCLLAWSDDDGRTWSDDIEEGLGVIGAYRYRARFNCLGMSTNRSFRLRVTDPVKLAVLQAKARIETVLH